MGAALTYSPLGIDAITLACYDVRFWEPALRRLGFETIPSDRGAAAQQGSGPTVDPNLPWEARVADAPAPSGPNPPPTGAGRIPQSPRRAAPRLRQKSKGPAGTFGRLFSPCPPPKTRAEDPGRIPARRSRYAGNRFPVPRPGSRSARNIWGISPCGRDAAGRP